jgi:hypothetical protein
MTMDEKKHREIARMDWKELARNLQIPEGGKTRGGAAKAFHGRWRSSRNWRKGR